MTYLAGLNFPGQFRAPAIHCDGNGCGAAIRIDGLPPSWKATRLLPSAQATPETPMTSRDEVDEARENLAQSLQWFHTSQPEAADIIAREVEILIRAILATRPSPTLIDQQRPINEASTFDAALYGPGVKPSPAPAAEQQPKGKGDVTDRPSDGDAGDWNAGVRIRAPSVQPVAPSAAKAPSPLPDVLPAGTRCTSGATLTGGIARLVTGPLNWYDAVEPARWVCKGYTAGGVTPEAIDWSSVHQAPTPAPPQEPEPGGKGPSDTELSLLFRYGLRQAGYLYEADVKERARALYTRGRSDEAKANEATVRAYARVVGTYERFVEKVRGWSPYHAAQVEELEAELAKAGGGKP